MADVQEYFAARLEAGAAQPGWWCWYAVQESPRLLIGSGGLAGAPDSEGTVTLGYGVIPSAEGKGYASEIAAGLIAWMQAQGGVKRIHATTFERHYASVRILEKNGFACKGVSSEDAAASPEDRRDRGRLMLFVREI